MNLKSAQPQRGLERGQAPPAYRVFTTEVLPPNWGGARTAWQLPKPTNGHTYGDTNT